MDELIESTVNKWLFYESKPIDRLRRMSLLFEKWNSPTRYNLLPKDDIVSLQAEALSVKTWNSDNIPKLLELAYKVPMNKRSTEFTRTLRIVEKMYWSLNIDDEICKNFVNMFLK